MLFSLLTSIISLYFTLHHCGHGIDTLSELPITSETYTYRLYTSKNTQTPLHVRFPDRASDAL